MNNPIRQVRFNPEINLGHVLSSISFLGAGIALYVSLVTNVNTLNNWRTSIDSLNLPQMAKDSAVREQRIEVLERSVSQQVDTNQEIIKQLAAINTSIAVLQVQQQNAN